MRVDQAGAKPDLNIKGYQYKLERLSLSLLGVSPIVYRISVISGGFDLVNSDPPGSKTLLYIFDNINLSPVCLQVPVWPGLTVCVNIVMKFVIP